MASKSLLLVAASLMLVCVIFASADRVDDMEALKFLRDSYDAGLITEYEYSSRKAVILDRVTSSVPKQHGNWTAPGNYSYNLQLSYLLKQFNNGLPRSYQDILPDGTSFWTTAAYLDVGAIDAFGNPVPFDSEIAIEERTLTRYGLNLYDGSTWVIALALSGLGPLAETYERNILYTSSTGANPQLGGLIDIRGDTTEYNYGVKAAIGASLTLVPLPNNVSRVPAINGNPGPAAVKNVPGAYFYRMIGPSYSMNDPFQGYYAVDWVDPYPNNDSTTPWDDFGEIHWNDWKPITGENVWGAIIGPLQRMWIQNNTNITSFTNYNNAPSAVQLALSILPALSNMQSPLGSMYHCPKGTNMFPPDPSEETNVSNENNFSSYAAISMLLEVLQNKTSSASDDEKDGSGSGSGSYEALSEAISTLQTLQTGLESWFSKYIMAPEGVIYQGGHVSFEGVWEPLAINSSFGGFAVDCQTWGLTVMGQAFVDKTYGAGTAYNIWQKTKTLAGYYAPDGSLGGVGYTTDVSKNSTQIWSAEWTFGAINMARKLAYEYNLAGESDYASDLAADAESMTQNIWQQAVRDADSRWIGGGLQQPDGSFLYANARFFIPWGWYSNPIGATCSTSWGVMSQRNFNPFKIGGGFVSAITGQ